MRIKELCERCNTTRKAVLYYEAKELLRPQILENGYRDYREQDLLVLKEIIVLRKCGLCIADIKKIVTSTHKTTMLEKCKYVADLHMQRLSAIQACMAGLIAHYDVESAFASLQAQDESLFTLKERLALAFPGNYGTFLAMHFGRFLNGVVDTDAQRQAYDAIIHYLDTVALHIPPELAELLEDLLCPDENNGLEKQEENLHGTITHAMLDSEMYLEKNRKFIEEYLEYKQSEAYQQSPAAALQKLLLDFQKQSGYEAVLVANMKILSPAYAEYRAQMERADTVLLEKFPQAMRLYNSD